MSSIGTLYTPSSVYPTTWWEIKIFDNFGAEIATIYEATNRQLAFPLNGIDSCQFTLFLDDPLIDPTQGGDPTIVRTMDRTVKVWRHLNDPKTGKSYDDPVGTPCFAGPITSVEKIGSQNNINIIAQNPLWRLQSRFHISNHYLVIDYPGQTTGQPNYMGGNMDGNPWDISALMFRLIDLINGAFGSGSKTGIIKPTGSAPFWPKTLTMGPFSVAKGDNTWSRFSELLDLAGGPDLVPTYVNDGTSDLMIFNTAIKRGTDRTSTVSYDYFTGNNNLDDIDELEQVVPDKFANFVWAVGQGSFNSAVWGASDSNVAYGETSTDPFFDDNILNDEQSIQNLGIYMHIVQSEFIDMKAGGLLNQLADAELKSVSKRPVTYTATPSPLIPPYFGLDFFVGDVVSLNAAKRALQISGVEQRIYEVDIALSDNLVEQYTLVMADDFYGAVVSS